MRPIPDKLRRELPNDKFMQRCCITGGHSPTFEHCWINSGKQINELWAIVPLAARYNTSHPPKIIKDQCRYISLLRAIDLGMWNDMTEKYPRKNWNLIFNNLHEQYKDSVATQNYLAQKNKSGQSNISES